MGNIAMTNVNGAATSPEIGTVPVDPAPRPKRRTFTTEYKRSVLAEYEAAPRGEKSAVLRREGLYHSHVLEWAAARDADAKTGRRSAGQSGRAGRSGDREASRLRAENQRLAAELGATRTALDIMGKAHALLEMLSGSTDSGNPPRRP